MDELPLNYVAGLFDGEGWFNIAKTGGYRHRSKREFAYQVHAAITLRQKYLLDKICAEFGGTVRESKNYSPKHNAYFRWRITGNNVLKFASLISDKLYLKESQAALAAEFQHLKIGTGNRPVSDEVYARYEEIYQEVKVLNKRGVGE